jgi:DNA-binding PadR family transcriptional regulator
MQERRNLTTTSFAILGWLDVRPWTTYELAKQMTANLNLIWPRAASRLYEEPKNLVAHGLATLERSFVGRRQRTVYKITDAGRAELRQWQATQSSPPSLDFEGLVHLYFGASATPAELQVTIAAVAEHAQAIFNAGRPVGEAYLAGTYPFPERAQFSGFIYDFLWSFAELLRDWAGRAAAEVAQWEDSAPDEAKRGRALALIRDCIGRERRQREARTA